VAGTTKEANVIRHALSASALAALLAGASGPVQAHTSTLATVETPRGVKQAFILIRPDSAPAASVILFAGGHGALGLKSGSTMKWGTGNFLVRTRERFADHGLMVAVIDAPADKREGMNGVFRMGTAHAGDIGAVAGYLKEQAPIPVWLVGTSFGSFSAAGGAIASPNVDGLVLTSTTTRTNPDWVIAKKYPESVASMALHRISVPTLILSHRDDGCPFSPAADAAKLEARLTSSSKVEVVMLDGGSPPQSDPCDAYAQHGFFGIEGKAVDAIARFIKANAKSSGQ
jgi:alpha/beta superfamily hydrolase